MNYVTDAIRAYIIHYEAIADEEHSQRDKTKPATGGKKVDNTEQRHYIMARAGIL